MSYCPNCDNIYDITKNIPKTSLESSVDLESPIGSSSNDNKSVKKNYSDNISHQAYFICKNCGTYEKIKPGTELIKKISESSQNSYDNYERAKDMIHAKYLPATRNYICQNTKCPSMTDFSKREAVFFRIPNSFKIRYVCKACQSSWIV